MSCEISPRITSRIIARVTGRPAELVERERQGIPLSFKMLDRTATGYVDHGKPIEVEIAGDERRLPIGHHSRPLTATMDLTREVLLGNSKANALSITRQEDDRNDNAQITVVYTPLYVHQIDS